MKKIFKGIFLSTLLLGMSCQNETIDTDLIDSPKSVEKSEVNFLNKSCGNSAAERSLGTGATREQGDRCSAGNNISNQPGLLDCRARHRGGHFRDRSDQFYTYNIEQGNKSSNVSTAVRIERTFRRISRPSSNNPFRIEFSGELKVVDLPFNDQGRRRPDYSNDYTYVCQMHGSGAVFNYAPFNNISPRPRHTTAIWLLRAQRRSSTTYDLVLEYSRKPRTNNSSFTDPDRTVRTFATGLRIDEVVNIELFNGYRNRSHNGYFRINGVRYNIPAYPFVTETMFVRYGAYRAGLNIPGRNAPNSRNQARIKWRNVTVCNP